MNKRLNCRLPRPFIFLRLAYYTESGLAVTMLNVKSIQG